jgi:hypothetical protein
MAMFDDQGFDDGTYDVAQICLNGHLITESLQSHPGQGQKFCKRCGAVTISACPKCNSAIRGHLHGVGSLWDDDDVPHFCENCGAAYPWTSNGIQAAKALADEFNELSDEDKILLKASIDDIASDTSMTEVASIRIKKLIPKLASASADALRKLLVDIASETAKKFMGL